MEKKGTILGRGDIVDEKYSVQFFIKRGSYAETYRVKNQDGENLFLKLFDLNKLHKTQFDEAGEVKEIEFLKEIDHPNILKYLDSGNWIFGNRRFAYMVLAFISGETIAEYLSRKHTLPTYEVSDIVSGILNGLKYLHHKNPALVHNDINHHNVMLDLSGDHPVAKIIDFGYARLFKGTTKVYYRDGLNPFYLAPECFNNIFSPQTDLFSVGALIFHLLNGMPPWFIDVSNYSGDQGQLEDRILMARRQPLKLFSLNRNNGTDAESDRLLEIAKIALSAEADKRFSSSEDMLRALNGELDLSRFGKTNTSSNKKMDPKPSEGSSGGGFEDIAGMELLKDRLYHDVIQALEQKELYAEYGLTIPNGMLLYGPPGCGKSYFARKLAEEVGYNYIEVKPSTLASIYVHGSQEKIGQLFSEARKNAPTIINFDEFDALVPKRDRVQNNQSGEVNEFLTQLDNCGSDGIFVIASTNQPNLIDPAILRAGRIDKVIYVPPPDESARRELFRLFLKKRPVDFGLDYDLLASMTENFVPIDIKQLVNEASKAALMQKSKITMDILVQTIENYSPTVKLSEIKKYERLRQEMEGINPDSKDRPRIGFK